MSGLEEWGRSRVFKDVWAVQEMVGGIGLVVKLFLKKTISSRLGKMVKNLSNLTRGGSLKSQVSEVSSPSSIIDFV